MEPGLRMGLLVSQSHVKHLQPEYLRLVPFEAPVRARCLSTSPLFSSTASVSLVPTSPPAPTPAEPLSSLPGLGLPRPWQALHSLLPLPIAQGENQPSCGVAPFDLAHVISFHSLTSLCFGSRAALGPQFLMSGRPHLLLFIFNPSCPPPAS